MPICHFSNMKLGRIDSCTIHRKADLTEYIPLQVFMAFVDEANRQLIVLLVLDRICDDMYAFIPHATVVLSNQFSEIGCSQLSILNSQLVVGSQ